MALSADRSGDRGARPLRRWFALGAVVSAVALFAAVALDRQGDAVEWQLLGTAQDGNALVVRPTVGDGCRTFGASIQSASDSEVAVSVKAAGSCSGVRQAMLPAPPTLTIALPESLHGRQIIGEKMAALSTPPGEVRAKYVLGSTAGRLPSTTGMSAQQAAGLWARYAIPTSLEGTGNRVVDQTPPPGTLLTVRDQQLLVQGKAAPLAVRLTIAD